MLMTTKQYIYNTCKKASFFVHQHKLKKKLFMAFVTYSRILKNDVKELNKLILLCYTPCRHHEDNDL